MRERSSPPDRGPRLPLPGFSLGLKPVASEEVALGPAGLGKGLCEGVGPPVYGSPSSESWSRALRSEPGRRAGADMSEALSERFDHVSS